MKFSFPLFLTTIAVVSSAFLENADAFAPTSRHSARTAPAYTTSDQKRKFVESHAPLLRMSGATDQEQVSIEEVSEELRQHKLDFDERMSKAETLSDAETIRRDYLGKKGPINKVMGYMRLLSNEDKPKLGAVVNEIKEALEESVQELKQKLERLEIEQEMESQKIDVTQPGTSRMASIGRRHPLSMTMEKAVDIFTKLGYDTVTECADSPEIETDYYCFEALNCPKDHPARDMQDTFYLTEDRELMLRTHTSAVQIRQLGKRKPPLRIVAPGRVYRKDDIDATHSLMFHQVEILALEKRGVLNIGHLKGTVEYFLQQMFGPNIDVRFRGSYFPFTEPSMEVDVFFRGRWLEVLGCGMVDPKVLEMAGIDPEEYSGFAAGFGVERFAMVMHGITDIREFYKNDKRFLDQFPHFYDDGMSTRMLCLAPSTRLHVEYAVVSPLLSFSPYTGLSSFLKGETKTKDEADPRGESVPGSFVQTLEKLKEDNAKAAPPAPKAEQPKKEKKQDAAPPSAEIDISKLDIRVGVISKAWVHPEADKLYCEEIDIGEDEPRQISSGLRAHYDLGELEGKRVLVLANLKSRKLVGFPSHGMVMCAASEDGKVQFVEPPADAAIGERITVEGYEGEAATENQVIKKKMLDAIFPDLKTNAAGVATYKGVPLSTSAGPCQPSLPNASVA